MSGPVALDQIYLISIANRVDLIRQLLQELPDLGLLCLQI